MKHFIRKKVRFHLMLAAFALSSLAVLTFTRNVAAQSFSITQTKDLNPKVGDVSIISVTNLAGKTQNLTVTVINPDSSLLFEKLNIKSEIVALGNSLVLFKDSGGFDHGTLIFSHPWASTKAFKTLVILSDASNTTKDTIIINVHDSIPPSKKHVMSISPKSPIELLMGEEASKSFDLTFTNLTTGDFQVSIDQTGSSNRFSMKQSSFDLTSANPYALTITYTKAGRNLPDSALLVFTPIVQGSLSETIVIYVVDSLPKPPYIDIYTTPFYNVPIDSKNCDNVTIVNSNAIPVIITALVITGADASEFSLNPVPSLPITIDKNSKLLIPYCFTAPNAHHSESRAELLVAYHSDGTGDITPKGYFYGTTESCVTFSPDSIQYGDLIAGGNAEGHTTITNTLDHAIMVTDASWTYINPANAFTLIGTTFPITLASKESKTLTFTYTPPANATDYATGYFFINYTGSNDSACTSASLNFVGHVVDPLDTSRKAYDLFPNIKTAMPIASSQQMTTKDFIFVNNTTQKVKVTSVSVKDGTHLALRLLADFHL